MDLDNARERIERTRYLKTTAEDVLMELLDLAAQLDIALAEANARIDALETRVSSMTLARLDGLRP